MLDSLLEGIPGVFDPLPGSMPVHCAEVIDALLGCVRGDPGTLKLADIAPEKMESAPKGKDRFPTIHFQVLCHVIFREDKSNRVSIFFFVCVCVCVCMCVCV